MQQFKSMLNVVRQPLLWYLLSFRRFVYAYTFLIFFDFKCLQKYDMQCAVIKLVLNDSLATE